MDSTERTPINLLTIKEVAERTGLPASTIRYYDQQFEDFLGIQRGAGRRRMFEPEAVERLRRVHQLLKEKGLSLRQARQALIGQGPEGATGWAGAEQPGGGLAAEVARLRAEVEALDRRMRELKEIQQRTLALVDGLTRG